MQSLFSFERPVSKRYTRESVASAILLLAGTVVAIAISTDGLVSRTVNGIAGMLWIFSAWMLLRLLRSDARFWPRLAQVSGLCLLLVIFVRPSDLAFALIGFSAAGAFIAATTGQRGLTWAALLPALWLPVHLATAVAKAVNRSLTGQEATLRSDPPPTAAVVPLAMIVGAMLGAWLVRKFLLERTN